MKDYDYYIEYIKNKHGNQKRKQGTPYYLHPVAVSIMLKEKGFPYEYQIAGLFHDLIEDTNTTYDEILEISNNEIVEAVRLVTKEENYNMKDYIDRISKNDMAKMVKLADRIHNLSESECVSKTWKEEYLEETKQWYLDLAKNTIFEEDLNQIIKNN